MKKNMMNLSSKIIAKIEFKNIAPKKRRVFVEMPIWSKKDAAGKTLIVLALLGGIIVPVDKEQDVDIAIQEAIKCFFEAAKSCGKGVEAELKALGWQLKSSATIRYKLPSNKEFSLPDEPVYAGMLQTADRSVSVSI